VRRTGPALVIASALMAVAAHAQSPGTEIALSTPSLVVATMFARNARVAAGISEDHKLRVWDLGKAALLRTTDVTGRDVAMTAMSDDGRTMLMGDYRGDITMWSVRTGEVQFEQHLDRYLTAAAFSHDGRLLAVAPGSMVRVYDTQSKKLLYELEAGAGSNCVAFSRDDALIATCESDGIRVYGAKTGKLVSRNTDFLAEPLAIDFTPDGRQVVAGGGDKRVLLIDAATGKTLRTVKTVEAIFYLEVSADGQELAVVTQPADTPQLPAPVAFIRLPSFQRKGEWMSPSGILLPAGAAWTEDGHFVAATATATALHLWRVR
jgi:WD40 repeat protein